MKFVLSLLTVAWLAVGASAQYAPQSYGLAGHGALDAAAPEPRLVSNVIIDIVATDAPDTLWIGVGEGLSRVIWRDRDAVVDSLAFESYRVGQGVGKGGASAILWTDSIIWASFAFDTSVGVSGAGGGLAYSRDEGVTWTWLPQPRDRHRGNYTNTGFDAVLGYWPTTTNVDNITYDIALSDSFVWIASKGGGLRRHAFAADYTDYNNDTTGWLVLDSLVLEPSGDTLLFHPGDPAAGLIHRSFSVIAAEGAVWVGTAAGILKSTNNGRTWRNFTAQNSGMSGNFITALGYQAATHTVWAASWRAEGLSEYYAVFEDHRRRRDLDREPDPRADRPGAGPRGNRPRPRLRLRQQRCLCVRRSRPLEIRRRRRAVGSDGRQPYSLCKWTECRSWLFRGSNLRCAG